MVAGHLQEKRGTFYMVISYYENHKRITKWVPTGLPAKGNKRKAEDMLREYRESFVPESQKATEEMLFSDYMLRWLEIAKSTIAVTTFSSYSQMTNSIIVPHFKERKITLKDLSASDIQDFYTAQLRRVGANSVIHYHAVIHRALKYAVRTDLIPVNPADKIDRPKAERYLASYYDKEEMTKLFDAVSNTKLELPVMLAAFYGLRRSEVLGLKWDAIDFDNNTISIKHTVTSCTIDGKVTTIAQDTTKTKSSMRTLPLVPVFKDKLIALKRKQEENRRLCGRSYCREYIGYICVDEMGNRMSPNYITTGFSKLLKKNGLRAIRFHDLRHSCASLLLSNGVSMKQIQEWLGHSDFSTTANIYAHLDFNSKLSSAEAMITGLGL